MTIKNRLTKNLKKYRHKSGLTQEQAAKKAGISLKYWQRLEMNSQVDLPSLPALFKVAEAVNTKANCLIK